MRRMKASEAVGTRVRVESLDVNYGQARECLVRHLLFRNRVGVIGRIVTSPRELFLSPAPVIVAFEDRELASSFFWRELERVEDER